MAHTLAIVLEIVLEIVLLRVLIVHLEIVFFACNFSGEKESKIVLYFDTPKRVPSRHRLVRTPVGLGTNAAWCVHRNGTLGEAKRLVGRIHARYTSAKPRLIMDGVCGHLCPRLVSRELRFGGGDVTCVYAANETFGLA